MTIHHFIPKSKGGTLNDTIRMCKTCHSFLHYCIPINEVYKYDSYEKLETHLEFKKYLDWIKTIIHEKVIPIRKLKKTFKQLK